MKQDSYVDVLKSSRKSLLDDDEETRVDRMIKLVKSRSGSYLAR